MGCVGFGAAVALPGDVVGSWNCLPASQLKAAPLPTLKMLGGTSKCRPQLTALPSADHNSRHFQVPHHNSRHFQVPTTTHGTSKCRPQLTALPSAAPQLTALPSAPNPKTAFPMKCGSHLHSNWRHRHGPGRAKKRASRWGQDWGV